MNERTKDRPQRDTKFQGFAKLLMDELGDQGFVFEGADDINRDEQLEQIKLLIARRAYDLVEHTLDHAPVREWALSCQGSDIPDLTELPKEAR